MSELMFISMAVVGAVALYLLMKGTPKARGHEPHPSIDDKPDYRYKRWQAEPPLSDSVCQIYRGSLDVDDTGSPIDLNANADIKH